jgi:hypothetical protein
VFTADDSHRFPTFSLTTRMSSMTTKGRCSFDAYIVYEMGAAYRPKLRHFRRRRHVQGAQIVRPPHDQRDAPMVEREGPAPSDSLHDLSGGNY